METGKKLEWEGGAREGGREGGREGRGREGRRKGGRETVTEIATGTHSFLQLSLTS